MNTVAAGPNSPDQTINSCNSTGNALSRAAKCFGRNVCEVLIGIPYVLYHSYSLATEMVCASGGAVVGTLRGGTVKLARAAGSKLGLCQKSTKPLSEYIIKAFRRGANVGRIPGKIMGGVGVLAGTFVITSVAILIPALVAVPGILLGAGCLAKSAIAYRQIKCTGHSSIEDNSKTFLRNIGHDFRDLHDYLYYGDKKQDSDGEQKDDNAFMLDDLQASK